MKILVLSTWFPYPPNQGSKTRAYHLIKGLARRHELALVAFEDQPIQPEWLAHMRTFCPTIEIVQRKPFQYSRAKTMQGWLSLQPSAVIAGYSREMAGCVQRTAAAWQPDLVFGITYVVAPYALALAGIPKVLDVDNLLANMLYEAYRQAPSTAERLRRYLAFWKFQRYERRLFQQFDLGLVVSEADAHQMRQALPAHQQQVGLAPNGVDLETHQPGLHPMQANQLVFSGALTYGPNFDAMQFFLGEILPQIEQAQPGVKLLITGKTDGVPLGTLGVPHDTLPRSGGVVFTGYLDDVRPAVASSAVCVVPLRMGAGTRLKILEAMALGTAVVSTTKGAEGLAVQHERHLLIADQPEDFARQTLRLMNDAELRQHLTHNAYQLIQERYDWRAIGQQLSDLVEQVAQKRLT